jgi:hypothetical protein
MTRKLEKTQKYNTNDQSQVEPNEISSQALLKFQAFIFAV